MYLLKVTDGVTTVELTAEPNQVVDFAVKGPRQGVEYTPTAGVQVKSVTQDSGEYPEVVQVVYENVTETVKAATGGNTLALAIAERERLGLLLRQAERVQAGSGEARVFVHVQRTADTDEYRSELLAGVLNEQELEGYWPGRGLVRFTLTWIRRPYWEAADLTEIALAGGGSAEPATGGLVLLNAPLGVTYCHYADLGTIAGDFPAPLKIGLKNEATSYYITRVYAAMRCWPSAVTFTHGLEGESARYGGTTKPAGSVDAECSNGKYQELSWAVTTESLVVDWTVSAAEMALCAGRWHRLIARLHGATAYTDLYLQARVTWNGVVTYWRGPWVLASTAHELIELGSVKLPTFEAPAALLGAHRLELWARRATSATNVVNLDYLAVLAMDGFRRYDNQGSGLDEHEWLYDDGIEGQLYEWSVASGAEPGWLAAGEALVVRPGMSHRLALLWEDMYGKCNADRGAVVQCWYRPRVAVP